VLELMRAAVVLFFAATLALSSAVPPKSQVKALIALWKATGGEDAGTDWSITDGVIDDGAENPCDPAWAGLTCSSTKDTITAIALSDTSLDGSIPKQISDLKDLTKLDVSENQALRFNQPAIGKLTKLKELTVSDCRGTLTSKIPEFLTTLVSLTKLDLSSANLVGTVPVGFSKLLKLADLDISNNKISGQISSKLSVLAEKGPGALATVSICNNDASLKAPSAWSPTSISGVTVTAGVCP